MRSEAYFFPGSGGSSLPAMLWLPDDAPRLVLQITHGMTEHIGRYEPFARKLTAAGVAVGGFDLRGHGRNPGDPAVASMGRDGWQASLEDMHLFRQHLAERYPGLPHVMLGFSLGSFLLREYLGIWPHSTDRAIIMGTGWQGAPLLALMMAIVKGQFSKGGFDGTTPLVRQLSFGAYNQPFRPNRTPSDWLCADPVQLDAYLADSLCRRDISAGLFHQLLGAMKRTGSKNACSSWNRDMPVLLLSGQEDPVGGAGKGVQAVLQQLNAAGMKHVNLLLIPHARHLVLCEQESGAADKAIEAITEWLA